MCGICGIYHHSHQKVVDREQIKKMCSLLIHRGPDDEGIFVQNNIGLGHRRLKIIDLSSWDSNDFFNLISKLTNGKTNTLDYIYYASILQEMLNRSKYVQSTK